jgi:hypothetical protein
MDEKAFIALRKHVYELSDDPSEESEDDEEANMENTAGVKFLRRTLQRLSDQAAKHAEKSSAKDETEDVFRGI